jgi:hypothetical protein
VYRITERTLKSAPIELAIRLSVMDGRLDRQSRVINLHAIDDDALVAAINNGHFRLHVVKDRRLLQRLGQRMAV